MKLFEQFIVVDRFSDVKINQKPWNVSEQVKLTFTLVSKATIFSALCGPFFPYFDNLPTYRGLSWTFGGPPTPCPRGHI